ncbi:hypothetical protein [Carnobacterium iners]|nr:hypothetical protein [Carnobacterium iners]
MYLGIAAFLLFVISFSWSLKIKKIDKKNPDIKGFGIHGSIEFHVLV